MADLLIAGTVVKGVIAGTVVEGVIAGTVVKGVIAGTRTAQARRSLKFQFSHDHFF